MLNKIRTILSEELGIDASKITEETTFKELGADSLDLLEMIMNLEDEYGVKFDTNRLEELKNVGEVIDYLKELGIEA
jgi:acyl carrier protein